MKKVLLATIALGVLAVLGVQGYYLYRLSDQVDTLTASTRLALPRNSGSMLLPDDLFSAESTDPLHWDPYTELRRTQERIDRIFGDSDLFGRAEGSGWLDTLFGASDNAPALDLVEKDDHFVVKVAIPGADETTLNVGIDEGRVLKISATTERAEEAKSEGENNLLRRERFVGRIERRLTLPQAADPSGLLTRYDDGVLTITVPKKSTA